MTISTLEKDYELSNWAETAMGLTILSLVINMIAFVATAWAIPAAQDVDPEYVGLGLWRFCKHSEDETSIICKNVLELKVEENLADWFKATQGLVTTGFIGMLLSFLVLILYVCSKTFHKNKTVAIVFVIVKFTSVIIYSIGIIVFGSFIEVTHVEGEGYFVTSWSFIMACVGAVIATTAGVLVVCEILFTLNIQTVAEDQRQLDVELEHQEGT